MTNSISTGGLVMKPYSLLIGMAHIGLPHHECSSLSHWHVRQATRGTGTQLYCRVRGRGTMAGRQGRQTGTRGQESMKEKQLCGLGN